MPWRRPRCQGNSIDGQGCIPPGLATSHNADQGPDRPFSEQQDRSRTTKRQSTTPRGSGETPMPAFHPSPDLDMHYQVDDFTDPWRQPQTILMLHGNAESGLAWYAWVPALARQYRVVRPDMRGFGQSTPMPRDYPWTLDRLVEDFCLLLDNQRIDRFHLVGAKIGGTVARAFAARRPERVKTLTVVGTPPPLRAGAAE